MLSNLCGWEGNYDGVTFLLNVDLEQFEINNSKACLL